jgi:hypothetical protein
MVEASLALASVALLETVAPSTAQAQSPFPDETFETLSSETYVVAGDFDGDGRPDAVQTACPGCPSPPNFFRGTGRGDFEVGPLFFPGIPPSGPMNAADLDRDGALDLVFPLGLGGPAPQPYPAGQIGVALGLGNGSFRDPVYYEAFAQSHSRPIIADVNGDGRLDVVSFTGFHPSVSVFLGRGDGTLRATAGIEVPEAALAVAAGDLNGDGRDDLVVGTPLATGMLIYLARSDGTFTPAGSLAAVAYALLVADVDGDRNLDVVASQYPINDLLVFRGDGHGGFAPPRTVPVGRPIWEIAAGDLNGDGYLEILLGTNVPGEGSRADVLVLLGGSDGDLDRVQEIHAGAPGRTMNLVDVDLDGRLDLVSVNSLSWMVAVLLGNGDGTFLTQDQRIEGSRPNVVVAADLNGDGRPDLASANAGSRDLGILLGQPAGGFASAPRVPLGETPAGLAVTDLNGDGRQDLAVTTRVPGTSPARGNVYALSGNGDGTFGSPTLVSAGAPGGPIAATDLDEDGHADLVYAETLSLYQLRGHGDGTFDARAFIANLPATVTSIATADFNGDDHADLGVCAYPAIRLRLGDGHGGTSDAPLLSASVKCQALTTGDFDADGHVDLGIGEIVFPGVRLQGRGMVVYSGAGDGTFALTWIAGGYGNASGAVAADFDADGIDDLAVSEAGDSFVAVILSRGDRSFEPRRFFAPDRRPLGLAAADLDGDDRQDLVAANDTVTGGLSIMINKGPVPDADGDGIPNRLDPCTDRDGDGFGDHGFRSNACQEDGCATVSDPGQADLDGDGFGDACDPCPTDPLNDLDHDGLCADADLCPDRFDPHHPDGDGDGVPDACDNCRRVENAEQSDGNDDGSGDACQPTVIIHSIRQDGGDVLEVSAAIADPQGDTLRTRIEITGEPQPIFVPNIVPDILEGDVTCNGGYLLGGPGQGFAYIQFDVNPSRIADLDLLFGDALGFFCHDGQPDYWFSPFPCAQAGFQASYDIATDLRQTLGGYSPVCIRPFGAYSGGYELIPLSADAVGLQATIRVVGPLATEESPDGLPPSVNIISLRFGESYTLTITVTDDDTVPVSASQLFVHQTETTMQFGSPPVAVVSAPATAECAAAGGAVVTLDGSSSTDADSTPGTNDAIFAFDWYEDFDTAAERLVGSGETIAATLALGAHALTLQVTDNGGESDTQDFTVTVADTTPPTLVVHADPATLWPPNHEMTPVRVSWEVADACDPEVQVLLVSVASSEPGDAPGLQDGATESDIEGADVGTADTELALRAERDGGRAGRTYTLTYRASDDSGKATSALAIVVVPHDEGNGPEPLLMRLEPGAQAAAVRLYWPAIPGAFGYDVIAGDLGAWQVRNGRLDLGTVRVLARATPDAWLDEPPSTPEPGRAFFYLIRQRVPTGPSGYGTESAPWPRVPAACEGGCP